MLPCILNYIILQGRITRGGIDLKNRTPYFSGAIIYFPCFLFYTILRTAGSLQQDEPRLPIKAMRRIISVVLALLLILPVFASAEMEVHFLNVGQGDCAIVICGGESIVIDGGPRASAGIVYRYIRETLGLKHIDCIVSTHPHVDHVYGLSSVLNAAPADLLLTPVLEWESKAFEYVVKYASRQGTVLSVPSEGDTLRLGSALVTVLHCWPEAVDYGRTNDSSIVLRIDYGLTSFLFTGDAEDWSEYMMIDAGVNLKADVLKVSHHGSGTASTLAFLEAVRPDYAVISVGKDNDYGHPHESTLRRLQTIGAKILRTDELGTIRFVSNGEWVTLLE